MNHAKGRDLDFKALCRGAGHPLGGVFSAANPGFGAFPEARGAGAHWGPLLYGAVSGPGVHFHGPFPDAGKRGEYCPDPSVVLRPVDPGERCVPKIHRPQYPYAAAHWGFPELCVEKPKAHPGLRLPLLLPDRDLPAAHRPGAL